MPSIRDVAAHAEVSVSTVSAVLNANKFVSAELKKRIEEAVDELGYQKGTARKARRNDPKVAVILPGIYSALFPTLLSGIVDVAMENQFMPVLLESNRSIAAERALLAQALANGIRHTLDLFAMYAISW